MRLTLALLALISGCTPALAQKLQPTTGIMETVPTDGAGNVCTTATPCSNTGGGSSSPTKATPVAHGGTITTGGTYQQVIASVSAFLCLTNLSADVMRVSPTGATGTTLSTGDFLLAASPAAGTQPGGNVCIPPSTVAVTVEAATTGDAFTAAGN